MRPWPVRRVSSPRAPAAARLRPGTRSATGLIPRSDFRVPVQTSRSAEAEWADRPQQNNLVCKHACYVSSTACESGLKRPQSKMACGHRAIVPASARPWECGGLTQRSVFVSRCIGRRAVAARRAEQRLPRPWPPAGRSPPPPPRAAGVHDPQLPPLGLTLCPPPRPARGRGPRVARAETCATPTIVSVRAHRQTLRMGMVRSSSGGDAWLPGSLGRLPQLLPLHPAPSILKQRRCSRMAMCTPVAALSSHAT